MDKLYGSFEIGIETGGEENAVGAAGCVGGGGGSVCRKQFVTM